MTKDEYGQVRDTFARALAALRRAEDEFAETAMPHLVGDDPPSLAEALDQGGYWLTGDEYKKLCEALALMESLTGRAHERSL